MHPSKGPFQPGMLIKGKYHLVRRIGEGAMGSVWAAVNQATSRQVAIKLLIRPSPEHRGRMLREAHICGSIRHPHVVDIYDADETEEGQPFLVMPLLSGETLSGLLKRRRRLDPLEAARIARDIARGLAAAHAHGIVHRDLKPSNIFLHNDPGEDIPIVKIVDFGVSKTKKTTPQDVRTGTGVMIGSLAYMSPDQALAIADLDFRSDLWAFGAVLYEMLTGLRAFQGDAIEVLDGILSGQAPVASQSVRNLDPRFDQLITRCLQRDRNLRPGSSSEVVAVLDAILAPPTQAQQAMPLVDETTTLPMRRDNVANAVMQHARANLGTIKLNNAGSYPELPSSQAVMSYQAPVVAAAPPEAPPAAPKRRFRTEPLQQVAEPDTAPFSLATTLVQRKNGSQRKLVILLVAAFVIAVVIGGWIYLRLSGGASVAGV